MTKMRLAAGIGACAALILISGCAATGPKATAKADPPPVTPTERWKAEVLNQPDQIALGVHAEGLSPRQREALTVFAGRWRDGGEGPVTVEVPAGVPGPEAPAMGFAVGQYLQTLGVPREAIRMGSYAAPPGPGAPVLARFAKVTVRVPNCAQSWGNLTSTMTNEPDKAFGCSVTANMAAQIADPRDLVEPRDLGPGDAVRRQYILNLYRQGKSTASEKDRQADGAVSSSVGSQ